MISRLPRHGRLHRPAGTLGPDDPGGPDPIVVASTAKIAICQVEFDTQTFADSTAFTVCEIDQIKLAATDVFEQANTGTYDYAISCKAKGLYYTEARITEQVNALHENRGKPRDLIVNWQDNTPNEISGSGWDISVNDAYPPMSAEASFVGWKNAVNSTGEAVSSGIYVRRITTITRLWFQVASAGTPAILSWAYRQHSGNSQDTTALGNGIVVYFPSEYDTFGPGDLTAYSY